MSTLLIDPPPLNTPQEAEAWLAVLRRLRERYSSDAAALQAIDHQARQAEERREILLQREAAGEALRPTSDDDFLLDPD